MSYEISCTVRMKMFFWLILSFNPNLSFLKALHYPPALGSIIAVRQGELIPLDGIVVKGVASVDESSISGEATPVEKVFESPAYSGTVIQNGYLEIETTSSSTSSTISKISAMVEDAQMNVSPTEIMVNKFAKFYTPLVMVVAGLVFLIPLFLGLAGVEAYDGRTKTWGERALIVLVTACPCALLMATPIVVICGINGAARLGALIKGGTYLEALGQINLLAFDKTGTLTEGKFQVVDLVCTFVSVHSRIFKHSENRIRMVLKYQPHSLYVECPYLVFSE